MPKFIQFSIMGIPKLLILKQFLSNSTLKSLKIPLLFHQSTKPQINLPFYTRTFSNSSSKNTFQTEILKFVQKWPQSSVLPLIKRCYGENSDSLHDDELRSIIRNLRRQKRSDRALEVSEWMMSTTLSDPKSGDFACQLSLIGQVHGVDPAEKFFNEVDLHTEKTYGALLNCYVEAKLVDKSLSHFKKMKDMGLAMSPLPYNNIMTLYTNTGQDEKLLDFLSEMEENGVSPDNFTYRICLKSFALKSDFSSVEKILRRMENQHGFNIDWLTYVVVANYYIEAGFKEKAFYYLQQAEQKIDGNPVGYNNLITTYAKIGGFNQMMNVWRKRRGTSKARINTDYMIMITSLVKLDRFEEAERFLHEWESRCSFYDFRVVNTLLLGYAQKGLVEKAETLLDGIIRRRLMPSPCTWSIVSEGHIKCRNMRKALVFLKRALELGLGSQHEGWIPNYEVTSSVLKWLAEDGEIGEVDEFVKLLSKLVPMNEEMYRTLLRVNIRHGKEIEDVLQRMKADNIDVTEELREIIESRTRT
ncbi:hypothetical protein RND81_12G207500 [Saponaria officinalis]|uniref:Pentatricopeptide repeat-containing protein n=1 Tax=Saponaria officinalis TaxID=3572 RepID=A0AAW1HDB3_SAPOF